MKGWLLQPLFCWATEWVSSVSMAMGTLEIPVDEKGMHEETRRTAAKVYKR